MDKIKKSKSDVLSEDDQKYCEAAVQEITDAHIKIVDETVELKQAEIMQL